MKNQKKKRNKKNSVSTSKFVKTSAYKESIMMICKKKNNQIENSPISLREIREKIKENLKEENLSIEKISGVETKFNEVKGYYSIIVIFI